MKSELPALLIFVALVRSKPMFDYYSRGICEPYGHVLHFWGIIKYL